jgi:DnaK suppressor protein
LSLSPSQRNALRVIIQEQLLHVKGEITHLEEKTQPIAPDCSLGRLTRFEAMGEQQVYEHALDVARRRYYKLEYALRKVDSESFGICSECDEPISYERLKLLPESTVCIACANEGRR